MALFFSKTLVKIFVCEKSVEEKKPFVLDKSEPGRVVVKCSKKHCAFKMIFHGVDAGAYQLDEEVQHTCQCFVPTIKRSGPGKRLWR